MCSLSCSLDIHQNQSGFLTNYFRAIRENVALETESLNHHGGRGGPQGDQLPFFKPHQLPSNPSICSISTSGAGTVLIGRIWAQIYRIRILQIRMWKNGIRILFIRKAVQKFISLRFLQIPIFLTWTFYLKNWIFTWNWKFLNSFLVNSTLQSQVRIRILQPCPRNGLDEKKQQGKLVSSFDFKFLIESGPETHLWILKGCANIWITL